MFFQSRKHWTPEDWDNYHKQQKSASRCALFIVPVIFVVVFTLVVITHPNDRQRRLASTEQREILQRELTIQKLELQIKQLEQLK